MLNNISQTRVAVLNPVLAQNVQTLARILDGQGVDIRVVQGLRTWGEQAALFAEGRSTPGVPCACFKGVRPVGTCPTHPLGATVTNCPPGYSWHNFGMAVDVAPGDMTQNGWQPDWNVLHPAWGKIVTAATAAGFVCGAGWTNHDNPHLQQTGVFPDIPTDQVRELFREGGLEAVWEASKLNL